MTVKQRAKWSVRVGEACVDYLVSVGAIPTPGGFHDYGLETRAGRLSFSPHGWWLACWFEDIAAARALLSPAGSIAQLNPHTGKWNFHFVESWGVAECVSELADSVGPLLLPAGVSS
jgi:hypothetical protein